MQFTGSVVVFTSSLPHAEVRRTIRTFHVEDQILNKRDFIRRKDYLQR